MAKQLDAILEQRMLTQLAGEIGKEVVATAILLDKKII